MALRTGGDAPGTIDAFAGSTKGRFVTKPPYDGALTSGTIGARYVKKQWRDTGLAAPNDKVTMVTTNRGDTYTGEVEGELVDEVILSEWLQ